MGELEPTTYVRDYFIGDGTTLGFYLSRSPYSRTTVTVFEEEYAGPGLESHIVVCDGPRRQSGGQVRGSCRSVAGPATVGLVEQIELAGGLRVQHGQVTFSAPSTGTLGGIYNGSVTDGNCLAGFRITPSGSNCAIQALIYGASNGTPLITQPGHQYALTTQLFANEAHRVHQTYCSSAHAGGNGRGGDLIDAAMRVVLSVHDVDPNNPGTLALPATVLFDDVLGASPAFASYALCDGRRPACAGGIHTTAADGERRGAEHDSGTGVPDAAGGRSGGWRRVLHLDGGGTAFLSAVSAAGE